MFFCEKLVEFATLKDPILQPLSVMRSFGQYLDVPDRKLGSMVSKLVISPTYKSGILGCITH